MENKKEELLNFIEKNNFGEKINKQILEVLKIEDIPFFIEYMEKLNSVSTHKVLELGYSEQNDLYVRSETGLTLIKN